MKTITINQANLDLEKFVNYTLETNEEINIASENGAVVMLPQLDYLAMLETLRLLSDKKSLKALLDSHKNRDMGVEPKGYSVKEVFGEL